MEHGLLIVDKPSGITSRDAVDRAQGWFPGSRLGHTGTLDPLASGVLVLCVGNATRLGEYVQRMAKTYRAGFLLGSSSDSDDADGKVKLVDVEHPPESAEVEGKLAGFVGAIEQVPPAYSAAKLSGRRAYQLARQGKAVALQPRRVHIHGIDILSYRFPRLEVEVRCGKGTYIRALARDLGARLGCGALVEKLRRTRVGPFDVGDALALEVESATARARLLAMSAAVAELPHLTLCEPELGRFCRGQAIPLNQKPACSVEDIDEVAVFAPTDEFVAVARLDCAANLLRPTKVFAPRS